MTQCIYSQEASRLVEVLWRNAWKLGYLYHVNVNNEDMTVALATRRTYIYGDERSAVVSTARKTIEGTKNMLEEDVLKVLKTAIDAQELM